MAGKQAVLLLATVVVAALVGICSAKSVIVGGSTGWTIPTSTSFYSNWASKQTFQVGDVLVFNFPVSAHTVAEVSKADYDTCNVASTIGPVLKAGPAKITLSSAGTHYFICTIPGHCSANQKLTVVATGPSAATPAPQPSPSSKKGSTSSPKSSPSPATSPAFAPSASTPSASDVPTPVASGPGLGPSSSTPGGETSPPPSSNFAASTGVSILSLLSIVAAALVF